MSENNGNVVHAGFLWRLFAFLIELPVFFVLLSTVGFVVDLYFPDGAGKPASGIVDPTFGAICWLYIIIVFWLYYALMESSKRQGTMGKMACGLKVTDLEGKRVSFGKASARYFAKIPSTLILLIGFLMVGFTRRKQALHDIVAGTLVVRKTDQAAGQASHHDPVERRIHPPGETAEGQ